MSAKLRKVFNFSFAFLGNLRGPKEHDYPRLQKLQPFHLKTVSLLTFLLLILSVIETVIK